MIIFFHINMSVKYEFHINMKKKLSYMDFIYEKI